MKSSAWLSLFALTLTFTLFLSPTNTLANSIGNLKSKIAEKKAEVQNQNAQAPAPAGAEAPNTPPVAAQAQKTVSKLDGVKKRIKSKKAEAQAPSTPAAPAAPAVPSAEDVKTGAKDAIKGLKK